LSSSNSSSSALPPPAPLVRKAWTTTGSAATPSAEAVVTALSARYRFSDGAEQDEYSYYYF
jgi:hypothetical protein